jgi:hypothetical protein
MVVPTQCPECLSLDVDVTEVPPDSHDRGDGWYTRAECQDCEEYVEWFE